MLCDASYLLHRVLHIPSIFNLTSSKGERTGGIFQFVRSLQYEVDNYDSFYPVVCWDAGLSKRRVKLYDNYKKNRDRKTKPDIAELTGEAKKEREKEDEYLYEYRRQRSELIEFLSYIGIPSIRIKGWEGDDLLYIISRSCKESIILTDDKDLLQLLDKNTYVSRPIAKEFWTLDEFLDEMDYEDIEVFVIKKVIEGDRSDNIPQVARGIGPVNAERLAKIIYNSDSEEEYLEKINNTGRDIDKRFVENHETYLRNKKLIDLSYVDITDEVLEAIQGEINQSIGNMNYFKAVGFLGEKEATEIEIDAMIANLNRLLAENNMD